MTAPPALPDLEISLSGAVAEVRLARPPIPSAVAFAPSPLMSAQITFFAPALAKRCASARPIPLAAPVTTTTLSLTSMAAPPGAAAD